MADIQCYGLVRKPTVFSQKTYMQDMLDEALLKILLSLVFVTYLSYVLNLVFGYPPSLLGFFAILIISFLMISYKRLHKLWLFKKIRLKVTKSEIFALGITVGITLIPTFFMVSLLSIHTLLPGGDPANYIWQAKFIESNNKVLVPWGPFPNYYYFQVYYPPFFAIFLLFLKTFSSLDYILCCRIILSLLFIISGLLYYAFFRKIWPRNYYAQLFVLFFMVTNMGLPLEVAVDGSYPEAIAFFILVPLFLNMLYRRRILSSGIVLVTFLGTHGDALVFGSAILLAFFLWIVSLRDWKFLKDFAKILGIATLLGIPLLPLYSGYWAASQFSLSTKFTDTSLMGYFGMIAGMTGVFLFYAGLVGAVFTLAFKSERLIGFWMLANVFVMYPFLNFTFGRILFYLTPIFATSLAVGIILIVSYINGEIKPRIRISLTKPLSFTTEKKHNGSHMRFFILHPSRKNIVCILLPLIISGVVLLQPIMCGIPQMKEKAYLPNVFGTSAKLVAYEWLEIYTTPKDKLLVLQFSDPYAKIYAKCTTFNVVNPFLSSTLSQLDKMINDELAEALLTLNKSTLEKYGVTLVLISSPDFQGTWPFGERGFISQVYEIWHTAKPLFVANLSGGSTIIYRVSDL